MQQHYGHVTEYPQIKQKEMQGADDEIIESNVMNPVSPVLYQQNEKP
jgi:hypothetical protein